MDLLEHLRRQFAYDAWANREVLAAIRANGSTSQSARPLQLLAHSIGFTDPFTGQQRYFESQLTLRAAPF